MQLTLKVISKGNRGGLNNFILNIHIPWKGVLKLYHKES